MDEFFVLRRLNIEIQGFPESYYHSDQLPNNVGMEATERPFPFHYTSQPHLHDPAVGHGMGFGNSVDIRIAAPTTEHISIGVGPENDHYENGGHHRSAPEGGSFVGGGLFQKGNT